MLPPRAQLPRLLARWTEAALGTLPPAEQLATCSDCVQLPPRGDYHPETKCCTYLPVLYNFQVGMLLDEPTVAARLGHGTPWGLDGGPEFSQERFGRDPSLKCPHLRADGRCGIWAHRNATCSTWFCRCDRGAASFAFWRTGLQRLLRACEDAAAEWAVFALGARDGDFGPWASDKRAFYAAATRAVESCSWDTLRELGRLDPLIAQARAMHEELLAAPMHPTGLPG